ARRVSLVADGAGRSLVVAATPADFKVVGELVAAFARTPVSERVAVRTYPLQNTTADRAALSLRELLRAQRSASETGAIAVRVEGLGEDALEATFDPSRVQVIAEPQSNALVVLAPDDAMAFIDRFVESNDRLPPADRSGLRVFPLRHARAEQIEPALSKLLAARVRDQRRRDPTLAEPSLAVDPRNNAIIATASQPQLAELAELLDTLDTAEGGSLLAAGLVEVVPVRFADANEVATTLDRFLRERATAAGQRTPEASVAASRSANALVVGGSAESIAAIRSLVEEMDLPRSGDREVEIIRVRRGDAASIAKLVNEQFSRRTTGGAGVAVSADPRTNSVIVNAPAAIAEEVKALVDRAYRRAKDLVSSNIAVLHKTAERLLESEQIDGDEFAR
ncbi:MAG: secretin N-terminal domain-containing protein, partial [Phycisphaerales bacterium]